jgi:D-alanyl-lipoteichoic acid acyltransferase DltB (MBOAT superfamily)
MSKITLAFRNRLVAKLRLPNLLVRGVRIFMTFQLVCLAWVYFRAGSIADANFIIAKIFAAPMGPLFVPAFDQFSYGLLAVFLLLTGDVAQEAFHVSEKFVLRPRAVRWAAYIAVIVIMVLTGVFDESQFIYFQF